MERKLVNGDYVPDGKGGRMQFPVPFNLTSMETAFGPEKGKALGEKLIHVVGIGVTDKRTALSQNTIQGGITHKEASLGFFFFKSENTMEVRLDGAQKLQVIGQISGGVKGIFSQQDRKLSLDSQTWPQRFLQYVIFS